MEIKRKNKSNLSIDIRQDNDDLFYLDLERLTYLAYLSQNNYAEDSGICDEKAFMPIRNALMHTSRLTQDAKDRLSVIYTNIKSKIKNLLSS